MNPKQPPTVGLMVTCLVDLLRPSIGIAALRLLQQAGCVVRVPEQTCCGQPAQSNGQQSLAQQLARQNYLAFADCDYVVLPSGSCAATMRLDYPDLLVSSGIARNDAEHFAGKVYELSQFLQQIIGFQPDRCSSQAKVGYHDSCAGLRQLCIKQQPRTLLAQAGQTIDELADAEQCCGFGGVFSIRFPELSCRIADKKLATLKEADAQVLLGGDLGCLLQLEGRLRAQGDQQTEVKHWAEWIVQVTEDEAAS